MGSLCSFGEVGISRLALKFVQNPSTTSQKRRAPPLQTGSVPKGGGGWAQRGVIETEASCLLAPFMRVWKVLADDKHKLIAVDVCARDSVSRVLPSAIV